MDTAKRVYMSNPEDLKRELSDLLVERRGLMDARTAWLCAKDQCVDGEEYLAKYTKFVSNTTRMNVIDMRINEICGHRT